MLSDKILTMVQYPYFFGILMRNSPRTITTRPAIFVGVISSPKNRAEPRNTKVFTTPTEGAWQRSAGCG